MPVQIHFRSAVWALLSCPACAPCPRSGGQRTLRWPHQVAPRLALPPAGMLRAANLAEHHRRPRSAGRQFARAWRSGAGAASLSTRDPPAVCAMHARSSPSWRGRSFQVAPERIFAVVTTRIPHAPSRQKAHVSFAAIFLTGFRFRPVSIGPRIGRNCSSMVATG